MTILILKNFQISGSWHRILNTSLESVNDFVEMNSDIITSETYLVSACSVCVFISENYQPSL